MILQVPRGHSPEFSCVEVKRGGTCSPLHILIVGPVRNFRSQSLEHQQKAGMRVYCRSNHASSCRPTRRWSPAIQLALGIRHLAPVSPPRPLTRRGGYWYHTHRSGDRTTFGSPQGPTACGWRVPYKAVSVGAVTFLSPHQRAAEAEPVNVVHVSSLKGKSGRFQK